MKDGRWPRLVNYFEVGSSSSYIFTFQMYFAEDWLRCALATAQQKSRRTLRLTEIGFVLAPDNETVVNSRTAVSGRIIGGR